MLEIIFFSVNGHRFQQRGQHGVCPCRPFAFREHGDCSVECQLPSTPSQGEFKLVLNPTVYMTMIGSGLIIIVISDGGKHERWTFGFTYYKFIEAFISVYFMQKLMRGKHIIECFSQRLSF